MQKNNNTKPPLPPQGSTPQNNTKKTIGRNNTTQRGDAQSKFNLNAEKWSLEDCYGGFNSATRFNVSVELDLEVVDRVDQKYIPHIEAYGDRFSFSDARKEDLVIETRLITRLAMLKKMIISTPSSQMSQITRYQYVSSGDLFIPPALSILISNIGKIDEDGFVFRIKDNVYLIHTLALAAAKLYAHHTKNRYRCNEVTRKDLDAMILNKVHFGDQSSTDKLRSLAKQCLKNCYETGFPVNIPATPGQPAATFFVSYPKLYFSNDEVNQVENFQAWIAKLHPSMPNVLDIIHAGLLTICQNQWFTDANLKTHIGILNPDLGIDAFNVTPVTLLVYVGWDRLNYNDYSVNNTYINLVMEAFSHMYEAGEHKLARAFNLVLQPHSTFGIQGQLINHLRSQRYLTKYTFSSERFNDLWKDLIHM